MEADKEKCGVYISCPVELSINMWGAQWFSGRVFDSRPRGRGITQEDPSLFN